MLAQIQVSNQDFISQKYSNSFVVNVYKIMSVGIFLSVSIALLLIWSDSIYFISLFTPVLFVLELIFAFCLSLFAEKIHSTLALIIFFFYSIFSGIVISSICFSYQAPSIIVSFFTGGCLFALMAFYGHTTKESLTKFKNVLLMGLLGIIMASILNIFFSNSIIDWTVSYLGVGVFLGLTSYDSKRIQKLALSKTKAQTLIFNASLILYIDIINLILSIFGLNLRKEV